MRSPADATAPAPPPVLPDDGLTRSLPGGSNPTGGPRPATAAPAPPAVHGYDVLGLLGQGGMGTVWRARQHGTDQVVALKLLGLGHADEAGRLRFAREVRLAAHLNH